MWMKEQANLKRPAGLARSSMVVGAAKVASATALAATPKSDMLSQVALQDSCNDLDELEDFWMANVLVMVGGHEAVSGGRTNDLEMDEGAMDILESDEAEIDEDDVFALEEQQNVVLVENVDEVAVDIEMLPVHAASQNENDTPAPNDELPTLDPQPSSAPDPKFRH